MRLTNRGHIVLAFISFIIIFTLALVFCPELLGPA